MGLALLVVLSLITLISSYFFAAKTWWMPTVASTYGPAIDAQFGYTYLAMGIIFIAAQIALGFFAWRYRDRNQQAEYSHGNLRMEATWTVLTAILFVVFDIEAVFIYPWAIQFKALGWTGLGSMFGFLAVVVVALVYVVKKGALEWES